MDKLVSIIISLNICRATFNVAKFHDTDIRGTILLMDVSGHYYYLTVTQPAYCGLTASEIADMKDVKSMVVTTPKMRSVTSLHNTDVLGTCNKFLSKINLRSGLLTYYSAQLVEPELHIAYYKVIVCRFFKNLIDTMTSVASQVARDYSGYVVQKCHTIFTASLKHTMSYDQLFNYRFYGTAYTLTRATAAKTKAVQPLLKTMVKQLVLSFNLWRFKNSALKMRRLKALIIKSFSGKIVGKLRIATGFRHELINSLTDQSKHTKHLMNYIASKLTYVDSHTHHYMIHVKNSRFNVLGKDEEPYIDSDDDRWRRLNKPYSDSDSDSSSGSDSNRLIR